jgi:hypothetical protein
MKVSTVLFFGKKGEPSHIIVPKILVFGKYYVPVYDGLTGKDLSHAIPVAANAVNNTGRAPHISEIDVTRQPNKDWLIEAAGRSQNGKPAHLVSAMAPSQDEYWHRFNLQVLTPDKFATWRQHHSNEHHLGQLVGVMYTGCVLSVTRIRLGNPGSSSSVPVEQEEPIYLEFDGSNLTDSKIAQRVAANPVLEALGQLFAEGRAAGQTWQPETLKDAARKLIGLADRAVVDKEMLPHWLNHAAETVQALASLGLNQESEALARKFMTVTCLTPHWDLLDGAGELRQRVVDSLATLTTA